VSNQRPQQEGSFGREIEDIGFESVVEPLEQGSAPWLEHADKHYFKGFLELIRLPVFHAFCWRELYPVPRLPLHDAPHW
jgi:hypothetical protein